MVKKLRKKQPFLAMVYFTIIVRLICGSLIFISPVFASVSTFILDWIDGEFYKRANFHRDEYEIYDKVLDYYWYVLIFFYILTHSVPFTRVLLFLFVFRSIGQLLYFLTRKGLYLFTFPNFFEILFLFYIGTVIFPSLSPLLVLPSALFVFMAFIVPFVIVREYIVHIARINIGGIIWGEGSKWAHEKL